MATSRHEATDRGAKRDHAPRRSLNTVALTGMGIGGIIGAGFFLGSGIVIRQVGPAVIITYLLAGLVLAEVMGAMTSLAVNVPVRSSYQEYIIRYLGRFPGFVLGWAVFISGVLAVGSEAVAMAVYSRTWAPAVALGVFAVGYVVVIVLLNTLGMADFGKAETVMAVVKSGILVGFIILAAVVVVRIGMPQALGRLTGPASGGFFPKGPWPVLRAMLIVIFSYAGVTTVAMATSRAEDPERTVPLAAQYTTVGVVLLYTLSVLGLVLLVRWSRLSPHQSPFVTALNAYHLVWPAYVFNAAILVASFSVMAGTFYATEWMLISLARQGGAPAVFRHHGDGRPWPALVGTALAILATLALAFILPRTVYTDLTAASSYFSFVNWLFILLAFSVWYARFRKPDDAVSGLALGAPYGPWIAAAAVVLLGAYSVTQPAFALGFKLFAASMLAIGLSWLLYGRRTV